MIPDPDPILTDEDQRPAEPRWLAERVDDLLDEGKPLAARSVLGRNWQDAVPELPLRYTVVLEQVSERTTRRIARILHEHDPVPTLSLHLRGSRRLRVLVRVSTPGSNDERLGEFSPEQAQFLHSLGERASLYRAQLTAIRASGAATIELVRPELRSCSSCERLHAELHVNCAECRKLRRPKAPERVESETPALALQEALDAIALDTGTADELSTAGSS